MGSLPVEVLVGVAADFFDSFVRDPPAPATTCLMGAVDLVPVVWIALPVSGSTLPDFVGAVRPTERDNVPRGGAVRSEEIDDEPFGAACPREMDDAPPGGA